MISTETEVETQREREILKLALAGDLEAYGEVYRFHANRLLRQAMMLCGNAALAEELTQDTLVEAWKSLRRYNGRCEFFTWLCAILLNRYRNSRRRHWLASISNLGAREREEFSRTVENARDGDPAPDEATQRREQAELVRRCIESLPSRHQEIVHLRFYVDDSLEGIAAALGCSVGTVKSRLFHALEKLRRMNAMNALLANLEPKE